MLSVNGLRCAETRIRIVSSPTTAITAPTTSSLRSAERVSHQVRATGSGWGCGGVFFLEGAGLLLPPLRPAGVTVLPTGFPFDFDGEEGVFRGITYLKV